MLPALALEPRLRYQVTRTCFLRPSVRCMEPLRLVTSIELDCCSAASTGSGLCSVKASLRLTKKALEMRGVLRSRVRPPIPELTDREAFELERKLHSLEPI